jgi:hypothetical protein
MIWILFAVAVLVLIATAGWFLLGFRLGGGHWQEQMLRTRLETASARRELHDLTRQAFVAMADHAGRQTASDDRWPPR